MTASEAELSLVKQILYLGLPTPDVEYPFGKVLGRRWRFDLAWPLYMLAVEIEGGTWIDGRHSRGASFELDAIKYAEALIAGWRVLRVTTAMVDDGRALGLVERAINADLHRGEEPK